MPSVSWWWMTSPIIADELSELLKNHLQDYANITVRTAYNAATVLKLIAQHSCDILISDIQMPGKSGLELAKEVREIVPDVNILFLTVSIILPSL